MAPRADTHLSWSLTSSALWLGVKAARLGSVPCLSVSLGPLLPSGGTLRLSPEPQLHSSRVTEHTVSVFQSPGVSYSVSPFPLQLLQPPLKHTQFGSVLQLDRKIPFPYILDKNTSPKQKHLASLSFVNHNVAEILPFAIKNASAYKLLVIK